MPKPTADLAPDPAHLNWVKFTWEAAKAIAVDVAAVFSFFASQNSEKAKQEAERATRVLAERSQQSQLDIKAYELVEKALSLDPVARKAHGIAAAAIVNALTRPPLREELQNALRAGVTDPGLIKQLDAARQFDQESYGFDAPSAPAQDKRSALPATGGLSFLNPVSAAWAAAGALEGYRVDIFYCEGSTPATTAAREARANQAAQRLQKSGVRVTARVRLLPTLVQARAGYQSFSDEIRFNGEAGERDAALQLAKIVGIAAGSVNRIEYRTPQYLSVFYCAGK
jgi:hypothetical protein